jgi:hypothetical protein
MICKFCSKELTNIEEDKGICFGCLYDKASYSNYPIEIKTKICSKCNKEIELSKFYKDKDKYDGYKTICKMCYSDYYTKKIIKKKIDSLRYYYGRSKRKKENWMPQVGKYYRYRKYFDEPNEDTIIFKIKSVEERRESCIIDFEPIKPKNIEVTKWYESKNSFHWTWKYEEIPKEQINGK